MGIRPAVNSSTLCILQWVREARAKPAHAFSAVQDCTSGPLGLCLPRHGFAGSSFLFVCTCGMLWRLLGWCWHSARAGGHDVKHGRMFLVNFICSKLLNLCDFQIDPLWMTERCWTHLGFCTNFFFNFRSLDWWQCCQCHVSEPGWMTCAAWSQQCIRLGLQDHHDH